MTDKEIVDAIAEMLAEHAKWCEEMEEDCGSYAYDEALTDFDISFREQVEALLFGRSKEEK